METKKLKPASFGVLPLLFSLWLFSLLLFTFGVVYFSRQFCSEQSERIAVKPWYE